MRGGYVAQDHVYGVRSLASAARLTAGQTRNDGLVYAALLAHLPLSMSPVAKHTIALNIELVAHGARPATLIESADYDVINAFYAAMTTIKRIIEPYTQVAVVLRRLRHPQFLVYNQARVPRSLVRAAMKSNDAMGKVLGYQCAGEQGSKSYVTVTYFFTAPTLPGEEELYTELCSQSEVDMPRVQRQLASYNAVAHPLGLSVRVFIQQPVMAARDLLQLSMQEGGVPPALRDDAQKALVKHLIDIGLDGVAAYVQAQTASNIRWPWYATLVQLFGQDTDMLTAAYAQHDGTLTRELVALLMETFTAMTPVLTDGDSNPLQQRQVAHIQSLTDVLTAILHQQYALLNRTQERVFHILKKTVLTEAASYMVTPWSPAMWDALYMLIVTVLVYDMFGLGPKVGLGRNTARQNKWLEAQAGVLFS